MFGVIELAYTLDHVGPLARDVHTIARILDAVVGPDPRDSSTAGSEAIRSAPLVDRVQSPPDVASLTLGVPAEFFGDHVDDSVEAVVRDRIEAMSAVGAMIRDVSVPLVEQAVSVWNAITNVEFATFLESAGTPLYRRGPVDAAWQRDAAAGMADDSRTFGDIVQRKAIERKYLVQEHDAKHYVAARNRCCALTDQFEAALADCDLLVTPTMPVTAPEIGVWSPHTYSSAGEGASLPLAVNTRPADLAGIPALTLPAGTDDSLPVGLQFIGGKNEDGTVLAAGTAFEQFQEESRSG